jgi:hypothetical protein
MDATEKKDETRGWAWPVNSRRAHFFVNGMSLCRKWSVFNPRGGFTADNGQGGPDDCAACTRALRSPRTARP